MSEAPEGGCELPVPVWLEACAGAEGDEEEARSGVMAAETATLVLSLSASRRDIFLVMSDVAGQAFVGQTPCGDGRIYQIAIRA